MTVLISRIIHVIKETRKLFAHPGSPTGRIVSIWAKVMVLPQFLLAPFTVVFGQYEGLWIFAARFVAMHIAYELEQRMPYTRAIGLCHLLTFGPLFVWFSLEFEAIYSAWGPYGFLFAIEYCIIGVCLYLDARDLLLHLAGRPFPCYARDYHRLGVLQIEDKRVEQPVTRFSVFFW